MNTLKTRKGREYNIPVDYLIHRFPTLFGIEHVHGSMEHNYDARCGIGLISSHKEK
jgi:hypothetical protein